MRAEMREWRNFGDISFLSEGGTMVRPAWDEDTCKEFPRLAHQYECLCFTRVSDDEVLAFKKQIDTEDFRGPGKIDDIEHIFGEVPDDEWLFAAYCAEYAGFEVGVDTAYEQAGMYASMEEYSLTLEKAEKWLRELGVPEEYIK